MSGVGEKKQSLVKYLMKQGVPLDKAKLIAHRKYYHETRVQEKWPEIAKQQQDNDKANITQ